jgi:hypothetical protein
MKTAIALLGCLLPLAQIGGLTAADDAKPTRMLLSQRKPGDTDRITALMEVGGEFKERGKDQRTPMSGVDNLTYYEMTIQADGDRLRAVRYYEKAQSEVKFRDGVHSPSLAEPRRLVGVAVDLPEVSLFALREPLTRDELDLVIDILGNSLLLDRLLPEKAVAVGDSWKPDDKVAAALLRLDGTTRCELQCTLKELTDTVARVDLSGSVAGPVNDTTAKIELKGKYRFDLRSGRIDWFALVTKEDRGISQAAAGFNVTVRFQMTVTPEQPPPQLAKENMAALSAEPTPESAQLRYESPQDRWQITYDRRWYLNSDDREHAVLKLIRQGALTGQCNISSLPQRELQELVSLENYQDDVRRALGKDFGEVVEAKQWGDAAGHRILRVVANGTAHAKGTDVPIHWIYYHVADRQGRQAALTFTVEQDRLEQFADADRAIVDSLRFAESTERGPLAKPAAKAQTEGSRSLVK